MKDTYTKALLALLTPEANVAKVVEGFKQTLKNRGHERLFVPVLRGVVRTLESKRPTTVVTVPSVAAQEKLAAEIKNTLVELGATEEPAFITDDTLIGGFVAEHNHVRVDGSYKNKLVSLYRNFTK